VFRALRFLTVLTLAASSTAPCLAAAGDTTADRALGQLDFTHKSVNLVDSRGLSGPTAIAVDASVTPNRLYVLDFWNNRVLAWRDAEGLANGQPADLVLGQPDFLSTGCNTGGRSARTICTSSWYGSYGGLAVDREGNLYVADAGNFRVLEFDSPFTTDTTADRVFGQDGSFTTEERGCNINGTGGPLTADRLCIPTGLAVDAAGNLYVTDNFRALVFRTPRTTDTTADLVFSGSFSASGCDIFAASADSLCSPADVAVDAAGNVYIADTLHNRVLEYDIPLTTDLVADRIFGQGGDFTAGFDQGCDRETPSATGNLCAPWAIDVDGAGNLYVVEPLHRRVVLFAATLTTDAVPDGVFGKQGSLTSDADGCLPDGSFTRGLCIPFGAAVDGHGNLYVGDSLNNRVLRYDAPAADQRPDRVLGQVNLRHINPNFIDGRGFADPSGIAVDRSVTPNRLYVTDSRNARILAWRDAAGFANGAPADLVIGARNVYTTPFTCTDAAPSAEGLCLAQISQSVSGLAVDGAGNLYVADADLNRVLVFDAPFATDTVADRVLGQGDSFTSGACNLGGLSSSSLCSPYSVAVDERGNLYVADSGNSRVLFFQGPVRNGQSANRVFGQQDRFRTGRCLRGSAGLCGPAGVGLDDQGNLYVADTGNHRVLTYRSPRTTDTEPDGVLGQLGLDGYRPNPPTRRSTLRSPAGVAVDPVSGDLYVADAGNSRVIRYKRPLDRPQAVQVFGQRGDFTTRNCPESPDADSLCQPNTLAVDDEGNLYVADLLDHRVLAFDRP